MSLFDRLRKKDIGGTATANFANCESKPAGELAELAGLALASPRPPVFDAYLRQYRFDLIEREERASLDISELRRCNNIVHHLVTVQQWPFLDAMVEAALWVAENEPHRDEALFIDVMELWRSRGRP